MTAIDRVGIRPAGAEGAEGAAGAEGSAAGATSRPDGPAEGGGIGSVAQHSIGRWFGRTFDRLGVPLREWAVLIPILALAAADRFVGLPARGIWDADQGLEVAAIWNAVQTRQLPTFGSPAFSVGGTFHHGAGFYDLMIPVAWLGGGNPTVIVSAIALFGLVVVPLVWWTARSIGGVSAGLATALLAAVSPSLIDYSTFIWNPVLMETGVALACLGAWQAWTTREPRWWLVAAAGTALASQSHLTGLALVFPMAAFFLVALRRCAPDRRRRMLAWGAAGVALFLVTWMPWIVSEATHNFAETRAILAFRQPGPSGADPATRLLISGVRILAWPLTHWPLDGVLPGFPVALAVAAGIAAGMVWRVVGALTAARQSNHTTADAEREAGPVAGGERGPLSMASREREGVLFVGGSLLMIVLILGLGIKEVSLFENINQEQYHVVADVLVILSGGLVVGGLWRASPLRGRPWSGRVVASVALAAVVAVSVAHWPAAVAADGGWPAAQAAAVRLEADAGTSELTLVNLPYFKGADAYGYPLTLDGVRLVGPAESGTVVILCDAGWFDGCGGTAEATWVADWLPGQNVRLIDRFEPAPGRILSVFRRTP